MDPSEKSFEDTIEAALLAGGADGRPAHTLVTQELRGGDLVPGGYRRRKPEQYSRELGLIGDDTLAFIQATQPQEWEKLKQHHKDETVERFLGRLSRELDRRGALDVLRTGVRDAGCKFMLAYFRPASGRNEQTQRLYGANIFSCVRQLRYSEKSENSLDLVLFLNGIPLFTAELKSPLNGQTVEAAVRQYKKDRDPREPLLAPRRCLAHFAVDPELVFVASELRGPQTRFLPFNQGRFGGAGNPPVSPTESRFATSYLWQETCARDSVLDLVRQFVHDVEEEDDKGKKTGKRYLLFPRYHQIEVVRKLVRLHRSRGSGDGRTRVERRRTARSHLLGARARAATLWRAFG